MYAPGARLGVQSVKEKAWNEDDNGKCSAGRCGLPNGAAPIDALIWRLKPLNMTLNKFRSRVRSHTAIEESLITGNEPMKNIGYLVAKKRFYV